MLFIATALASDTIAAAGQPPSLLMNAIPFLLIFVVFYLLLIRPQMKKQKEHQSLVQSIHRGDKVVTAGGIVGTVAKVEEEDSDIIHVEIAPNVKVRVIKSTITSVVSRIPPAEEKSGK